MLYINNNKLNSINLDNNFCIIMDFDRTITTSDSFGSWAILENPEFMNPKFKEASLVLKEKYYPFELDYSLDDITKASYIEEWYIKNMDLLYEYGLTNDILLNCVKHSNIKFRDGFINFFYNLHIKNIPVIIFSAGIGNVIVELLKSNNCYYDNVCVISNFIEFKYNKMIPFKNKMIHTSNKSLDNFTVDNSFFNKDYIILFGDLVEDLNMPPKKLLDKTISFGFLETNVKENFDLYKKVFDVVLTNNPSFLDVEKILNIS